MTGLRETRDKLLINAPPLQRKPNHMASQTAAAFTGPRDRAEKKGACAERHGWCDRSRERRETRLVRLEPRARVVVSQALPTLADGRTRSVGRRSHSATVNSGKYAQAAQRLSRDCSWPWEHPRAPLECGRDPEGRPR
ncbi:hypothetical protein NDU88_008035 [Pleurodeles waltl]|uniref:Uncharacterized protein n=1 Tax=Pleurodeles waltl TaxID=8319 RepID=A0AAV7PQZ9_PLEWA|nr:hypothetical protein NDU88_008035 [Pleurodeles waltl]